MKIDTVYHLKVYLCKTLTRKEPNMNIEELKALLLQDIKEETDDSILSKLLNYYEYLKEEQTDSPSPYCFDELKNNSTLTEPKLSFNKRDDDSIYIQEGLPDDFDRAITKEELLVRIEAAIEEMYHKKRDENKPPCQYSLDELKERLAVAEAEVQAGGGTNHSEFMQEVDSWK